MTGKRGTYVGLRVLNPANSQLYTHCKDTGIPVKQSMFENRLHTTVIYSRKHCPNIVVDPTYCHVARFAGYDIFTGQRGENVLVMKLNAPSIAERHKQLMAEHGATYDYTVYIPHITLSYDYTDNSTLGIPAFPHEIVLGYEYVEDLDLECGR